ncbi:LLM class flavin-dependent oxidoreductase [Streptomyces tsukubensis]|uniref:LLM class flavin-dependent oxidoreductase n=1 Tax=Streptomyces tsukubensis TaxID=83656 RepID=UPI0034508DDF
MTGSPSVPLSVLDLSPVWSGSTPAQALRETLDLARAVEELGYHRYWLTEHHNAPGVASSSPPVLIGQIAAVTRSIRVGAGGVMLPNHPPLVVAEQFGTLEALHPGRIDLGLGRAPGTDPATAQALRRNAGPMAAEEFPQQIVELAQYFTPESAGTPARISAVPAAGNAPAMWLLGSSPSSARLAAALGLPFAYAYHFNAQLAVPALRVYREEFRPSGLLDRPHSIVAVFVIAAATDAEALRLAAPIRLATAMSMRDPRQTEYRTTDEAAAYRFSEGERRLVDGHLGRQFIGGPDSLAPRLEELLTDTGADELMAMTVIEDYSARVAGYEILRDLTADLKLLTHRKAAEGAR